MSILARIRNLSLSQAPWNSCLITARSYAGKSHQRDPDSTTEEKGKRDTKPYRSSDTVSGTTEQVEKKDSAFDSSTVDPKQEMHEMEKESSPGESPLQWSGANEEASKQHKGKKQPVG
ncbi:hypothetical protein BZG36_05380 [Bifiguratus adelaidae]|uniref:Uncharacterized protein n=1 Tax=Bifiguratus adelaidae TaxID=1938954 RepID=A0A261XTC5_9FUNG|nr:hypothetical protein BZG36_05380 [Bifiguratus adelaidae]